MTGLSRPFVSNMIHVAPDPFDLRQAGQSAELTVACLRVGYQPNTDPGNNAMTYLHKAIASLGRLDLFYRSQSEFKTATPPPAAV